MTHRPKNMLVFVILLLGSALAQSVEKPKAFSNIFTETSQGLKLSLNSDSVFVIQTLLANRDLIKKESPENLPLSYIMISTLKDESEGESIIQYQLGFSPKEVKTDTVDVYTAEFLQKFKKETYRSKAVVSFEFEKLDFETIESKFLTYRISPNNITEERGGIHEHCDPAIQGYFFKCPKKSTFRQMRQDVVVLTRMILSENFYQTLFPLFTQRSTFGTIDIEVLSTEQKVSLVSQKMDFQVLLHVTSQGTSLEGPVKVNPIPSPSPTAPPQAASASTATISPQVSHQHYGSSCTSATQTNNDLKWALSLLAIYLICSLFQVHFLKSQKRI